MSEVDVDAKLKRGAQETIGRTGTDAERAGIKAEFRKLEVECHQAHTEPKRAEYEGKPTSGTVPDLPDVAALAQSGC